MPSPDVYEKEYVYWPWGEVIERVSEWVASHVGHSARVLDYMCGTGYLLRKISVRRPDLSLVGCDLNEEYVDYANSHPEKHWPEHCSFDHADVLSYQPYRMPHVVLVTGGLHHLAPEDQPRLIAKIASELSDDGVFVLADEFITDFESEVQRRLGVLELSNALGRHVISNFAYDDVVRAVVQMMENDLFQQGEYKTSRLKVVDMLEKKFRIESCQQVWPREATYGDFIIICRKRA